MVKVNEMVICTTLPGMVVFMYPNFQSSIDYDNKKVEVRLNMAIYRDLKQFGVIEERVDHIDFDKVNKKLIAILK